MFLGSQISNAQTPPIDAGVSRELARWRAVHYSDVRYKLNLTLEKMSLTLKGSIEIKLKVSVPGAVATSLDTNKNPVATAPGTDVPIILDWRKIKGKEQFVSVSNVNINGNAAKFEETNEHLVFKEGVKAGENVIKLDFTSPIATSGAAVTRYVDKEDGAEYIYSLFVPSDASTAFPVFDQPDLKARFRLNANVPDGWKFVSNAELESEGRIIGDNFPTDGSDIIKTIRLQTYEFKETQPISTYVFAFAAGEFERFVEDYNKPIDILIKNSNDNEYSKLNRFLRDPNKTKIFIRKSQAEKFAQHSAEVFRLNREAVKHLESYFDYKFPFPKYDLVLIPEFPFGGMEHAGATFLRESSIIFPQEPTANDYISRGNLIFHEAAHQWFGDTVTMRWFDDLWLKEGFAEFMAYKTMERVLPQYNAWKAFYERNKPLAYLTDSTRGTTPIYQEIPNLSSAKSAYGNIVYRKAPAFLKQAEFYLGEKEFQVAVRAFLKKHEFANAEWQDLVSEFQEAKAASIDSSNIDANSKKSYVESQKRHIKNWAETWVKEKGVRVIKVTRGRNPLAQGEDENTVSTEDLRWMIGFKVLKFFSDGSPGIITDISNEYLIAKKDVITPFYEKSGRFTQRDSLLIFPNYQDYGYGIFLLDEKSRDYVLANIQNEKDDFLRSMMWGALWDSVREAELNPKDYVELAIKNISGEKDELTIQTILSRISTAMNYYLGEKQSAELAPRLEKVLLERMNAAETLGQRIVFYRAFLNLAASGESRQKLKEILSGKFEIQGLKLKTKDKFDIVTRLLILNDAEAPKLLEDLAKTETSDEAKRYAYAARAGFATAENKGKFFADFLNNKEISESYIESAVAPFNSVRHAEMTLPFLEKALAELPNLKRTRKIFFVNNWLGAFLGGQRSEQALAIVNKFLADNPNLDRDLRLKILENVDGLERSVKIRKKFAD